MKCPETHGHLVTEEFNPYFGIDSNGEKNQFLAKTDFLGIHFRKAETIMRRPKRFDSIRSTTPIE